MKKRRGHETHCQLELDEFSYTVKSSFDVQGFASPLTADICGQLDVGYDGQACMEISTHELACCCSAINNFQTNTDSRYNNTTAVVVMMMMMHAFVSRVARHEVTGGVTGCFWVQRLSSRYAH